MRDYQHIATFTYPSELTIVKSLLESENIECYVRDELTIQVHNFYSNAIGGIRLEIPVDKINIAKKLLIDSGFENTLIDTDQDVSEVRKQSNSGLLKFLKYAIPFIVIAGLLLIGIVVTRLINE